MHDAAWRPDDPPSKDLPYALVPHADPKNRELGPQLLHYLQRYARVLRPAYSKFAWTVSSAQSGLAARRHAAGALIICMGQCSTH